MNSSGAGLGLRGRAGRTGYQSSRFRSWVSMSSRTGSSRSLQHLDLRGEFARRIGGDAHVFPLRR